MSSAELEEHRSKNLCLFCHDKFSPGHTCPQRQKMQVFVMELEEQSATPEDIDKSEEKVDKEECCTSCYIPEVPVTS